MVTHLAVICTVARLRISIAIMASAWTSGAVRSVSDRRGRSAGFVTAGERARLGAQTKGWDEISDIPACQRELRERAVASSLHTLP